MQGTGNNFSPWDLGIWVTGKLIFHCIPGKTVFLFSLCSCEVTKNGVHFLLLIDRETAHNP